MSRILVLGRLRRVDHKFEKGSTGDSIYTVSEGGRSR